MTEGEAGADRGRRVRLLAGWIFCLVGLLLGAFQVYSALLGGKANVTAAILGIAYGFAGYYLGLRKLATAIVVLCTAAVLFGLAASQGLVPDIALADHALAYGSFQF